MTTMDFEWIGGVVFFSFAFTPINVGCLMLVNTLVTILSTGYSAEMQAESPLVSVLALMMFFSYVIGISMSFQKTSKKMSNEDKLSLFCVPEFFSILFLIYMWLS